MTIEYACDELQNLKKRTKDGYIISRLDCIIEDLTDFMNSPSFDKEKFEISKSIAEQIDQKRYIDTPLSRSWVNMLYFSTLGMFRFEQCKQYCSENKKLVQKEIDGETWSKGITIITAIITLLMITVAVVLYSYGIGVNDDGGFDYDMWAFVIAALGAVIIILGWIIVNILNLYRRKKYADSPYSIEELLAVKYENEPKKLLLLSPAASRMRDCQIATGNNSQSEGNKGKAKNGSVYQNAGDVRGNS